MCSSRKYPHPATEGNRNSEGSAVQKEAISEGVGVGLSSTFSGGSK